MAELKQIDITAGGEHESSTIRDIQASNEQQEAKTENHLKSPEIYSSERPECVDSNQSELPNTKGDERSNSNDREDVENDNRAESGGLKKNGRRVKFPDGENIILAYHEHPSPWHAASECSTEGLVAAYKQACAKFDVKPLPKLMQQLNAIANFHERNETLTLRGERLDVRHCETIEEILRRVQFRTIDLEATHLDDESAIALFDMIEYYHSATRINISYNKLGVRGWQSCSRMLKKTSCIEQLDAKCCTVLEQVMPVFGRAIRMGSMLSVLHLENSVYSGRTLMILVAAIKMNEPLRELFLADNKLMPSDGIQLGNMLKFNHKLTLLDVRNNHLGDVGVGHICDGLCEQTFGTGLQTLVVWNNQVTYQAMSSLSRALRLTQSLETINLGHNNITNEGIHRLKDSVLFNKTLLRIGLQCAKISCEGAVALAECIAESPRLLRLDLRENDIKTGGLMALSLALKVNLSVTRIDLDQKSKRENSVRDYAEQQQRLLADITMYSLRNRTASLQREEEERQRRMEEELRIAMQDECNSVEEETVEMTSAATTEAPSVNSHTVNPTTTSPADSQPSNVQPNTGAKAVKPRALRLDLPAVSRTTALESPVEAPPVECMPLDVPPTVPEESSEHSPVVDFPPSPMVSSEGKTILAAALAEEDEHLHSSRTVPEIADQGDAKQTDLQAMQPEHSSDPVVQSTDPVVQSSDPAVQSTGSVIPPNITVSHEKAQTPQATKEISRSPSPRLSPVSRRKFTIQRVPEPHSPVSHSSASENYFLHRNKDVNEPLDSSASSLESKSSGTGSAIPTGESRMLSSASGTETSKETVGSVTQNLANASSSDEAVTSDISPSTEVCSGTPVEHSEKVPPINSSATLTNSDLTGGCEQQDVCFLGNQGSEKTAGVVSQPEAYLKENPTSEDGQTAAVGESSLAVQNENSTDESERASDSHLNSDSEPLQPTYSSTVANDLLDVNNLTLECQGDDVDSVNDVGRGEPAACGGAVGDKNPLFVVSKQLVVDSKVVESGVDKSEVGVEDSVCLEKGSDGLVSVGNSDVGNLGNSDGGSAMTSHCDTEESAVCEQSVDDNSQTKLNSASGQSAVIPNGACLVYDEGQITDIVSSTSQESHHCDIGKGGTKSTSELLTLNGINVDITSVPVQDASSSHQEECGKEPDDFEKELNEILATAFAGSGDVQVD